MKSNSGYSRNDESISIPLSWQIRGRKDTHAYLVDYGGIGNYNVGFLVLIVALYQVLFDYRTTVVTLVGGLVLSVLFALVEVHGVLPSASLFSVIPDPPYRSNPQIWSKALILVLWV